MTIIAAFIPSADALAAAHMLIRGLFAAGNLGPSEAVAELHRRGFGARAEAEFAEILRELGILHERRAS